MQPSLAEFCKKLRGLGYEIKLDTNGSAPEVISDLIQRKLITYLALDLKADPASYPPELTPNFSDLQLLETIKILKRSTLAHEFRTTVAAPFITRESIKAIAQAAVGEAPLYLQPCRLEHVLDPVFMAAHPQPTLADLNDMRTIASAYLPTFIRR